MGFVNLNGGCGRTGYWKAKYQSLVSLEVRILISRNLR
jgi:hypothetical protein